MMYIICEVTHGRLIKDEYRFLVKFHIGGRRLEVHLDRYTRLSRPTARHAWRQQEWWSDRRENSTMAHRLDAPPVAPSSVVEDMQQQLEARTYYEFKFDPIPE